MKKLRYIILFAFLTIVYAGIGQSAGLPPPPGSSNPAPFGFVELLLGAGALYGGKKAYDKRQEKNQ